MEKWYRILAILGLILPLAAVFAVGNGMGKEDSLAIDPDQYPVIGDEELGQLRWVLRIAEQPIDDFTLIGAEDQYGGTAYRYTLAFMVYFLALEQYHKLPACPEIIQPAMDRLIQKMLHKQTWEYWAEVSRGLRRNEPFFNKPYPESHNPIVDQNIMYSGHLGHMIGLYETLYRDLKWDEQGSIVFAWSDQEKYVYDNHSLQKVMHEQMKKNSWHSIACEPNAVFPACNQHPVMSFILYDYVHGTDLAAVNDQFMDFFLEKRLIDPWTHHAAAYYLVKQKLTITGGHVGISASMDGWTGAFMYVWQPEYIMRHYPYMRRDQVIWESNDGARLRPDYGPGQSLKYGYFAMMAKEVGDVETADKLIQYAEKVYLPKWDDGAYIYYPNDRSDVKIKPMALTGKLIALARANPPRGLWAMHNQPFEDIHFTQPMVSEVDFPHVLLRRAIYDADKKALIITTEPGTGKKCTASIKVSRLDPGTSYRIIKDGKSVKTIKNVDYTIIKVVLEKRHDIVVVAE